MAAKKEEEDVFKRVQMQTVTSWGRHEKDHPINAFEQVIECAHCGAWRAPKAAQSYCCLKRWKWRMRRVRRLAALAVCVG